MARDETEMLGEHESYHEMIDGKEARRRLQLFHKHCYLTRFSETSDCYILSVYKRQTPNDVFINFEIVIKGNGKVQIKGKKKEFDNIKELLNHYENNRIDPALSSIGRMCPKLAEQEQCRQDEECQQEQSQQEEQRQQEEQHQQEEQRQQEEQCQQEEQRQQEEQHQQEEEQRRGQAQEEQERERHQLEQERQRQDNKKGCCIIL